MPGQPYALGAGLVRLHRLSQASKHQHQGSGVCYSLLTCFTEITRPGEAYLSLHSFAQPIRYVLSIATGILVVTRQCNAPSHFCLRR